MKKLKLAGSILLIYSIGILPLHAQQQETPEKWTLQQLIEYAIKENIQIRQSELDRQTSEVAKDQAWWRRMPDLNANANQSYNFGRSIDPFTNSFTTDPVRSNNFSLSSNMTLFAGFQIYNSIQQSKADLQASMFTLEATKNSISLNVANFYLNILFNQELLAAAQLRLLSTQTQFQQVEKQVQLGALPQANLLQVKQQLATDELQVVQAENTLALSRLALVQALQLPADTQFDLDVPQIDEPQVNFVLDAPSIIYEQAEAEMPEIKAASKTVESRKLGLKVAKGAYSPTLSVNASVFSQYSSIAFDRGEGTPTNIYPLIGYEDQTNPIISTDPLVIPGDAISISFMDQIDLNRRENLSFSLSIPIFTRFQTKSQVSNAKINLERAELGELNAKNTLRQSVEQAYYNVIAAAKTYDATQKQVAALEESNRNITQRFELGAANVLEYNQTKNDFNRAQSDLIRAKYDYIFKLKVLDFYQGKPLQF